MHHSRPAHHKLQVIFRTENGTLLSGWTHCSTLFDSAAALSGHVKGTCTFFSLYNNTAGHDSQLQ
tara:strand:+ start:9585 stop:9779 length:195 start_codon:yes stop_codon:yes gene_type:complete